MTDAEQGLHARPSADELLEAVEELLRGPVLKTVSGPLEFQTRVAANVVAMVRRELGSSTADDEWLRAALADLGFDSDEALATAIRHGHVGPDQHQAVTRMVRESVRRRVDVAHPGYREE